MGNRMTAFLSSLAMFSLLFARLTLSRDEPMSSAPSCNDVVPKLAFCLPYISGANPSPSDPCCNGVKTVAGTVKTKDDAVSVCNCLKDKLAGMQYQPALIASLPGKCMVNIELPPISKDTDCSKAKPPMFMLLRN